MNSRGRGCTPHSRIGFGDKRRSVHRCACAQEYRSTGVSARLRQAKLQAFSPSLDTLGGGRSNFALGRNGRITRIYASTTGLAGTKPVLAADTHQPAALPYACMVRDVRLK